MDINLFSILHFPFSSYHPSMPQLAEKHHLSTHYDRPTAGTSRLPAIFWSVLAITTFVRFVYALKVPLSGDEAYFWEWGRHPALGYYDHPPVAGWILWFTRQIFGDTVAAVRIPAVLAGTLVPAVIYRFTLDITGSVKSAALTGLLAMGIPVISVLGVIYTTDTPVLAAGTVGGYFFYQAVHRGDNKAWIWTGICFAVVVGSKFLGIPLLIAAGLYTILNPGSRRHLKTAGPYIAAGISLLGIVPVIIWNASNEWATFTFNFVSRHSALTINLEGVLDYLAGQSLALSPLVFFMGIPLLAAAVPVWRDQNEGERKIPAFLAMVPLGGFLILSFVTKVGLHWPAVAVPFLAVALGASLTQGQTITRGWIAATATAWFLTVIIFLIPLAPYILPADWAYPLRPDRINTAQLKKLVDSPSESGAMVRALIDEMGTEKEVFVFTRSYVLSSLVAFYVPDHPEVTVLGKGSVHGRNHVFWFTPADHIGKSAVFISYKPVSTEKEFIESRFESWETVIDSGGPEGSLYSVVKCYGYNGIR